MGRDGVQGLKHLIFMVDVLSGGMGLKLGSKRIRKKDPIMDSFLRLIDGIWLNKQT